MKLTRRETTLLAILLICGLSLALYYGVFSPMQTAIGEKQKQYDSLELQKIEMEALVSVPDLTSLYQKQKDSATENYDSFYAVLNSYSIDTILSGLMDEFDISVQKMKISPYMAVEEKEFQDAITQGAEVHENTDNPQRENLLLKCTVDLEAGGDYENVKRFIDAMNDKSFCLSVEKIKITTKTERNLQEYEAEFTCVIGIYGIKTPTGLTPT